MHHDDTYGLLVAVDVKVKILLRHLVVGPVSTQLSQRFIKRRLQLNIVFTQANAGAIANYQGPDQMAQRVRGDYAKWGQVIRDKGIVFE